MTKKQIKNFLILTDTRQKSEDHILKEFDKQGILHIRTGLPSADYMTIRYDNEGNPHIEVHQKINEIPEWVSKMFWTDWFNEPITDYYVIVVPEGTISTTETYEIDME